MSLVNVINVIVLNPKAMYTDKISFEIFFEALQPLQESKSGFISQCARSKCNLTRCSIDNFYKEEKCEFAAAAKVLVLRIACLIRAKKKWPRRVFSLQ